ncbi:MAG: hypothetical protein VYA34_09370 [Myxococcota bacterium]|nr:hypothetical protein [Myxococcota bacterium]
MKFIVISILISVGTATPNESSSSESATVSNEEAPADVSYWNTLAESLTFNYSFTNSFGMSNFMPGEKRAAVTHAISLGMSAKLTEEERFSLSVAGSGEFFTKTGGGMGHVFWSDSGTYLRLSTSRVPELEIEDYRFSLSPSLIYYLPVSRSSRLVTNSRGRLRFGAPLTWSWNPISVSLTNSLSYAFYKYSHIRYNDKPDGDRSQEGSLLAPLSLSVGGSIGVSHEGFSGSVGYTFIKSRTFENNAGDAFWRDYASFGMSVGYSALDWLNLGLSYAYGYDPLDNKGDIRNPFFNPFADYYNASELSFNISGSFDPFNNGA